MNKVLVDFCTQKGAFPVINKIFPEELRGVNDSFYSNALSFLIQLERSTERLNYVPSWLSTGIDVSVCSLIENLIKYLLTYFDGDDARKVILLASSVYKRIYKILAVLNPGANYSSELRHLLTRYNESEFSWRQILSSPQNNLLTEINSLSILATDKFVKNFTVEQGRFNIELAKQHLKALWSLEINLLKKNPRYLQLLQEKDLGELYPTECSSVIYDSLGHTCLCVIKPHERWKDYVLNNHKAEICNLEKYGSWAAKQLMESEVMLDAGIICKAEPSNRFFFGDDEVQKELCQLYGYH
ncbi:TPA: hypothetical protein NBK62_004808 [Klebsiella pneumoniae]|nr:hypothetical protein [Klebsiella pneumoniae]